MISNSYEETFLTGVEFAKHLAPGSIVCLQGDLGAGKTAFVKGAISFLTNESPENISSPTFTYVSTYEESDSLVHHFDLYRLSNDEEFMQRGFHEFFSETSICFLEWPDRIISLIPKNATWVNINYLDFDKREIIFNFHE